MLIRILLICLINSFLYASNVAIVKTLRGESYVTKKEKYTVKLKIGYKLKNKDIITTKENSGLGIVFNDGTIVTLGENSIFSIDEYIFTPAKKEYSFDFKLHKGASSFESGKIGKLSPESVKFRVPKGIIGIRGTRFYVEVNE